MIEKGQMLSQHDFSNINGWILTAAALLFVPGTLLLLIPLLGNLAENEALTLLQTGTTAILLGSMLLILRHFLHPTLTYRLYEHGVQVINQRTQQERFITFEKIADIYHFRGCRILGGLFDRMAFRTATTQPWFTIYRNISHSRQLSAAIIHQQVQLRGPLALTRLYRGEMLAFTYITGRNGIYGKLPGRNDTLQLSVNTLRTAQVQLPIELIHRLEKGGQHDTLRLFDLQGNELLSINYFSLCSADLFIALVEHMIENRIPAYSNPEIIG